jgi:hypothetical protein
MFLYNFLYKFFRFIIVRTVGLKNILYYNIEYLKLKYFLDQKKVLNIVYDLSCQSLSVGNFAIQLFYARYFSLKNFKIKIFIINDKIKSDHNNRNSKEKNLYYKMFLLLAKATISSNLIQLKICAWESFIDETLKRNFYKNNYIIEKKKILSRKVTRFAYLINKLTFQESNKFMSKYLFDKFSFYSFCSKRIKSFKNKKYISLIVRYDKKIATGKNNSISRNINKNNLLSTIDAINVKFPNDKIFIVSDSDGCKKAKNFLKKYRKSIDKKIYYSKDYTVSIIEDIFILINGKCIILNPYGGGTLEYARMSKTPFFFTNHFSKILLIKSKEFYNRHSRAYWWNGPHNSQVHINSYKLDDFLYGLKEYKINHNKSYIYSKI